MSDLEYYAECDFKKTVDRIVERMNRVIDEKAVEQVEGRLAELGYRKCSDCKERQGYYLDSETIRNQQERIAELEARLTKARAEAERYRELLGIARDHAHAALVDTEGNVIG